MVKKKQDINTEEKILQTAMDVFVEKGRHGARMQEIADRAGINKALLHYYFRTKEKLYIRIFKFIFNRIAGEVLDLLKSDLPFEEFLRTFISKYIDILNKNHRFPLFIMRELSQGGNVVSGVVKEIFTPEMSELPAIHLMEEAMERGEIVKMDPRQTILTILGSCLFYFMAEPIIHSVIITDEFFDRQKFIEERKEAIFNTIYYGLVPRGDH